VWALRAQTDKRHYARQMLQLLQHTPNCSLRERCDGPGVTRGQRPKPQPGTQRTVRITGVRTFFGSVYCRPAVILTTGTFLGADLGGPAVD